MFGDEILVDKAKNGKVRPWKEKKLANLTYAEYLQILEIKKAFRVKKCGNLLTFTKSENGLKLYQTWFCKSRLCPLCAWRYAMKNSYELSSILDVFYKRYPKSRFLFLTLTEENAKQGELKEKLAEMNGALYKLFQYKKVQKDLLGYVRSTEITVNRKEKSFHQHIHILLAVSPTYFKKGHYLSQDNWSKLWQKARKLDYKPVVNIKTVSDSKKDKSLVASAKEVAKYQVKSSDYITEDVESDLEFLKELEKALFHKRQLSFGGEFKVIRKELKLEDHEDDLVHVDGENTSAAETEKIIFLWNNEVKNYVNWIE